MQTPPEYSPAQREAVAEGFRKLHEAMEGVNAAIIETGTAMLAALREATAQPGPPKTKPMPDEFHD